MPVPFNRFDIGALALVLGGLGLWVASPDSEWTGIAVVGAGLASLARLARWRGRHSRSEPLLWILHIGYAWVVVGLIMLGAAVLLPALIPYPAGIHALGAGAIGTMILAVMTRATRGHTGHSLEAGPGTVAIYTLITLAATLRVAAPFAPDLYVELIVISGIAWIAAFSLFVTAYGPMLLTVNR